MLAHSYIVSAKLPYDQPPIETQFWEHYKSDDSDRVVFDRKWKGPFPSGMKGIVLIDAAVYAAMKRHFKPDELERICLGYSKSLYYTDKWMDDLHKGKCKVPTDRPPDFDGSVEHVWSLFKNYRDTPTYDFMTELYKVYLNPGATNGIGFPHKSKRGDRKCRRLATIMAKKIVLDFANYKGNLEQYVLDTIIPDIGLTRTQLSEIQKPKIRCIHGRSTPLILMGGCVTQPLMARLLQDAGSHIIAFGLDYAKFATIVNKLRADDEGTNNYFYILMDWSAFDKTVCRFELIAAFGVIRRMLKFPNMATYYAFCYIRMSYLRSKLVAPDGNVYKLKDIIPSGDELVVLVDTIVNANRKTYLQMRITGSPQPMLILQDDSLERSTTEYGYREILAITQRHFACILKEEKLAIANKHNKLDFLSHYCEGITIYRQEIAVIRSAVFPERYGRTTLESAMTVKMAYEDSGSRYARLLAMVKDIIASSKRGLTLKKVDAALVVFRRDNYRFARH